MQTSVKILQQRSVIDRISSDSGTAESKEKPRGATPALRLIPHNCRQMVNGKWLPDFIERLKASA